MHASRGILTHEHHPGFGADAKVCFSNSGGDKCNQYQGSVW